MLYISAVHFPLLTEARQSLPAQPIVLLLATIGVAAGSAATHLPSNRRCMNASICDSQPRLLKSPPAM